MANLDAPEGQVYVCMACGKRSRDKYGERRISYGWDVSCMMNSSLFAEDRLVIEGERVVSVKAPSDQKEEAKD